METNVKQSRSWSRVGTLVAIAMALVFISLGSSNAQLPSRPPPPPVGPLSCTIQFTVIEGGFIIGAAGGQGTLNCGPSVYPIEVGGIAAGLLIGLSGATLTGPVRNLYRVADIAGTYSGGGGGIAVGGGVQGITLANSRGVQLVLSGTQIGIEGNLNFSGATIRLR
jgi:hypothetical protein